MTGLCIWGGQVVEDDLGSFPLDLHAHISLPLSAPCKDLMDQQKKKEKEKTPQTCKLNKAHEDWNMILSYHNTISEH